MEQSLADLRQNYTRDGLLEEDADPDPFIQFKVWFDQVLSTSIIEPNAMTLATVGANGQPKARIVLLKHFDDRGFTFFTNYNSHKGQELEQTPQAALVFWWGELERQIRIEGSIEKVDIAESDGYFSLRPWESRLGAWASQQSEVIESRDILEKRLEKLKSEYADLTVPRPPHWGGFRLIPDRLEFWQGRPSRLHDRLCYRRLKEGKWLRERLSP
jgi:pyridoxamine 5'-phosphate oxidase